MPDKLDFTVHPRVLRRLKRDYTVRREREPGAAKVTIWIDLDNTPHVPFFGPIIRELEGRGHRVEVTARDAFQVCELADELGIAYRPIGRHWGGNPIMKVIGLLYRSAQMLPFCLSQRPDLALSHGSRSQVLLSKVLRIPTVVADDYEGSRTIPFGLPKWMLVPDAIPQSALARGLDRRRLRFYRGLKEDVYVPDFKPDPSLLDELGLGPDQTIVTVRPPADEAHYRDPHSDLLFAELMSRICGTPGIRAVLLPRNHAQGRSLRETHPDWFSDGRVLIPSRALNGLNLLWYSDLVVSGGGTMNREAAALGIPAFSIFGGKIGAVDSALEREGRLTIIRTADEVRVKIPFTQRDKSGQPDSSPRPALVDILGYIEEIIRLERTGAD
jgi:uncharacterized protein